MSGLPGQSEAAFQSGVVEYAGLRGWLVFHPPDNRPITTKRGRRYVQNTQPGFPDLTMGRRRHGEVRLIFAELKREDGRASTEQLDWLEHLQLLGLAVERAVEIAGVDLLTGAEVDVVGQRPRVEAYLWRPSLWPEIERILS